MPSDTETKIVEQLQKGQSLKAIAKELGYSGTARISSIVDDMPLEKLNVLSRAGGNDNDSYDTRIASFTISEIKDAGFDPEEGVYFKKIVDEENGQIILDLYTDNIIFHDDDFQKEVAGIECPDCDEKFISEAGMKRHKSRVHE